LVDSGLRLRDNPRSPWARIGIADWRRLTFFIQFYGLDLSACTAIVAIFQNNNISLDRKLSH
jgi:hypothetical protein